MVVILDESSQALMAVGSLLSAHADPHCSVTEQETNLPHVDKCHVLPCGRGQ